MKHIIHCAIIAIFSLFSCTKSSETINNISQDTLFSYNLDSISFFVISDWGWGGTEGQKAIACQMSNLASKISPSFVISCGDNFQYEDTSFDDSNLWTKNFEEVYNFPSLKIPWFVALGNHDYIGDVNGEIAYSKKNALWHMPSRFYSFTVQYSISQTIRFIVLDTYSLVNNSGFDSIEQYRWLKHTLSEAKEDWIIVIGHYPVFSSSHHHGNTKELVNTLFPLLNQYHVDYYLCGHDHNFEHLRVPDSNIEFLLVGTGGDCREFIAGDSTIYGISSLGFANITIANNKSTVKFIQSDGTTPYKYIKTK